MCEEVDVHRFGNCGQFLGYGVSQEDHSCTSVWGCAPADNWYPSFFSREECQETCEGVDVETCAEYAPFQCDNGQFVVAYPPLCEYECPDRSTQAHTLSGAASIWPAFWTLGFLFCFA